MKQSKKKKSIISRIRHLRKSAQLTQLELSQKVGVTEASIQNWENGRAGVEQIERVVILCEVLNCMPGELIQYVDNSELENDQANRDQYKLKEKRQRLGTDDSKDDISNKDVNTHARIKE